MGRFPISTFELLENWVHNKFNTQESLGFFILAGLLRTIWRTRNKMAIEKKFPKNPIRVLFYGLSFLQK